MRVTFALNWDRQSNTNVTLPMRLKCGLKVSTLTERLQQHEIK